MYPLSNPALSDDYVGYKKDACYTESTELARVILTDRNAPDVIRRIAIEKLNANEWKQAAEISSSIEDETSHDWIFEEITRNRLEAGDLEHAIECAREIFRVFLRAQVMGGIARKFVDREEWKRAEEILFEVPDEIHENALVYLILKLYDAFNSQLAVAIINKLEGEVKDYVLFEICKKFIRPGNLIHAFSFVGEIQDDWKRSHIFQEIAKYVLRNGEWRMALQFAAQIPLKRERLDTQLLIAERLYELKLLHFDEHESLRLAVGQELQVNVSLSKNQPKKALEIAYTIPDPERKSDALYQVGLRFIQTDEAIVLQLVNEFRSESLMRNLCAHYLSRGQLNKALEICDKAPRMDRNIVLKEICTFYAKEGDVTKVQEILALIKDETKRDEIEDDVLDTYYGLGLIS